MKTKRQTHGYIHLQFVKEVNVFVMNVYNDIVSGRKIIRCCLWSHGDKTIAESSLVRES